LGKLYKKTLLIFEFFYQKRAKKGGQKKKKFIYLGGPLFNDVFNIYGDPIGGPQLLYIFDTRLKKEASCKKFLKNIFFFFSKYPFFKQKSPNIGVLNLKKKKNFEKKIFKDQR